MKKFLLIAALVAAGMMPAQTSVATWQDVTSFPAGTQFDGGVALASDGWGNIFTVGTFAYNVTIGSVSLTNNAANGTRDIYVAKYDYDGNFVNAIKLGSASDDEAYSIAYKDGMVFVGALVAGRGTIYKLFNSSLTVSITRDLGDLVHPRSIVPYGTSRLVVGGSFFVYADLPTSGGVISLIASNDGSASCPNGCYDSFTGIIDMSAYFTYAGNPFSSTNDNEIMAIACRNGYIYSTGYFKGQMQWDNGGANMTAAGVQDLFVASVHITTSVNQINFVNDQFQGGSIESQPSGAAGLQPDWKECGYGIAANGTAIYVTGNLNNASTRLFNGVAYTGSGAFVARVDYSGSQLGTTPWVRASETCSTSTAVTRSIGYGIGLDALGNIFATGSAYGNVEMQGGGVNPDLCITGNTDRPGFICRYEADGDLLSIDAINQRPESGMRCDGKAILVNGCEVYVTGWVTSASYFQAGALPLVPVSSTTCSAFIFEIDREASISSAVYACVPCSSFPLTGTLSISVPGATAYSWSPGTYLSSTTSATPSYSITSCAATTTNYTVTVSSSVCPVEAPFTIVTVAQSPANAGADILVCPNTPATIGTPAVTGYTYSWWPVTHLWNTYNQAQPTYTNTTTLSSPMVYQVTATDICGNVTTDLVTVSNNPNCRIANPNQPSAEVFPNPSTGMFTVNLPMEETDADVEFVVTDLTGRTVQQTTVTTAGGAVNIDLTGQAKGVYLLSVTRNGVTETHQLIIE